MTGGPSQPCTSAQYLSQARWITRALRSWYRRSNRALPWRENRDPYAVWISEVMLQQTQVKTALNYYQRWLKRFPTLRSLAEASEDQVLHAWQGLGYYSRARRLRQTAQLVCQEHDGALPTSAAALSLLPGLGPYSAGAIASIAFDEQVPAIDGNVVRVICRVFALSGDPQRAKTRAKIHEATTTLVPRAHPGEFNQALMELGATVCSPKNPNCAACPLASYCQAHRLGNASSYPEIGPRAPIQKLKYMALALTHRGRALTVQESPQAKRWAGMWLFPNRPMDCDQNPRSALEDMMLEHFGLRAIAGTELTEFTHSVSNQRITLTVYRGTLPRGRNTISKSKPPVPAPTQHQWRALDKLTDLAMPAPHRKIAELLIGSPRSVTEIEPSEPV